MSERSDQGGDGVDDCIRHHSSNFEPGFNYFNCTLRAGCATAFLKVSKLCLYRVNTYYLDRDGRNRLEEIGATDAASPGAAVRAVIARYRDADRLDEIGLDSPSSSGMTVAEPFDRLNTYHVEWYADETDLYVWLIDEQTTDSVDTTSTRR